MTFDDKGRDCNFQTINYVYGEDFPSDKELSNFNKLYKPPIRETFSAKFVI